MKQIEVKPETQADKFHLGHSHLPNGEKWFAIVMVDKEGKVIAHGHWPRADWERMKKEIDDIWMAHDIDAAVGKQKHVCKDC